jgi:uncharacterized protein
MAKSGTSDPVTPLPVGSRRCPICGKPAAARHQPFCSARCADIDLGRWLKGNYSIPTEEAPEDAGRDEDR